MPLTTAEEVILKRAVAILERDSFVAKLTAMTGEPVSRILKALPRVASNQIHKAVQASLKKALDVALRGFDRPMLPEPTPWMYRAASSLAGGASGFLGLPALAVELPITTLMILRAIAAIARERGENLKDPAVRLACLEVLALAPKSRKGSSIPIVGAVGGAAINLAFMDHFQKLAWAHFSVRQLERIHGVDTIRSEYEKHNLVNQL
jgi:hypothetical protein